MIYLVRHGQTDWNLIKKIQGQLDIPLNETGKMQADEAGRLLSTIRARKIISSDLSRTKQTAEIINRYLSLPLTFDSKLRELNYGDLEGVVATSVSQEEWHTFNFEPEKMHAEDLKDFYNRVKSFFDELEYEDVVIVTHGGTLRMAMIIAQNKPVFNREEFVHLYQTLKIKNASVFEWDRNNDEIQPVSGNEK